MARSKHLDNRLTKAQEIFVQELLKGNTQIAKDVIEIRPDFKILKTKSYC